MVVYARQEVEWVVYARQQVKCIELTCGLQNIKLHVDRPERKQFERKNAQDFWPKNILFQISLLAPRITNSPEFLNISDITSDELDSLGQLLDGFNASFFNKLSDEALQSSTVHSRVTFASKAKVLYKLLHDFVLCPFKYK